VRNKLYELGLPTSEVEQQLTYLIEHGILNEERFARAFARGKFRIKQWGREKIKQQLRLRKISDYCIKKAMTEIDAEEYDAVFRKLASKKSLEVKTLRSPLARKARLYKYLLQKGYERDLVIDVINELI
jgi:regulatory protein